MRCGERLLQLFARTGARVDRTLIAQLPPGFQIELAALTLRIWGERSTDIWTLLPIESQPAQVLIHCFHKFHTAALRVQVFIAKDKNAVRRTCALLRDPESPRVAEMKISGGRGRNTPAIFQFLGQSPKV